VTEQAISPLRRCMIEDMTIRKFAQKTQHDYVQEPNQPDNGTSTHTRLPCRRRDGRPQEARHAAYFEALSCRAAASRAMVSAGSPASPASSSPYACSRACSAGWSWRSLMPLIVQDSCSSSASAPHSPMRKLSRHIWRHCVTVSGRSTADHGCALSTADIIHFLTSLSRTSTPGAGRICSPTVPSRRALAALASRALSAFLM
jgi:hypothetical protein